MGARLYPIFLHVALIALATTSLGLVHKNRQLISRLAPSEPQLEIGASVEPVEVQDLDGMSRTLHWGAHNTDRLFFVFTTTCPACQQNQEHWQALHQALGSHLEIVGISLDGIDATRAYRETNDLPFGVFVAADRDAFTTAYEISSVPSTFHINREGKVEGAWVGTLSGDRQADVAASAGHRTGILRKYSTR